jgi:hypothetical protein
VVHLEALGLERAADERHVEFGVVGGQHRAPAELMEGWHHLI